VNLIIERSPNVVSLDSARNARKTAR